MENFSQKTVESLGYYVYVLIDPRDNKIFYVGKGKGNRVFAHVKCAVENEQETAKFDIIRAILKENKTVKHYILRHKLTEREAYLVESVFIDFLKYSDFEFVAKVSTIAGHHQWDEGIKTVEELEILYDCQSLTNSDFRHKVLSININKTYDLKSEDHPNIYEATRKSWKLNARKIQEIDFVFSEYRGIVRAIFKPEKWLRDGARWMFEGVEVTDKEIVNQYLHKSMPPRPKGSIIPTRYFYPQK